MQPQIIYFSKKGNTKKIAEAMATQLKVNAEDVNTATLKKDTFVLLGSGNYAGNPAKVMTEFISNNDFSKRTVALFGTSGGGVGNEVKIMQQSLESQGADIKGTYYCKGKFLVMNRGRPNEDDLKAAQEFAKKMMK